ncbi:MAG TPA: hypothetical protein VJ577_20155 [Burkholderiaceae bacterium]|nr:hypothetical protein [Burkholderiaceae bacterium]
MYNEMLPGLALASVNLVDAARKKVVVDLLETRVVSECWGVWKNKLRPFVGSSPTPTKILELGTILSETFRESGQAGRDPSSLSGGGAAWEGLVCYYLNLCLIGTNAIVFKKRSSVPRPVQEALTITYGTVPANTESDLVCVTFPADLPALATPLVGRASLAKRLDEVADAHFAELRVTVVQCKTNWNDNAQIPMMWDMLYNASGFKNGMIMRGRTYHFDPSQFSYAFVTVPTNKLELYNPNSLAVRRVAQLSGGNYWGRPQTPGIALDLGQIFNKAGIGPNHGKDIRTSLKEALPRLRDEYAYFDL